MTTPAGSFTQRYTYDSLYRLTKATEKSDGTGSGSEEFTYRYGNRITQNKFIGTTQLTLDAQAHPTIDSDTNRFEPGQGFTFDKNGNIQTDAQGRLFVFNGDNKQKEVRDAHNNLIGEYFYDGEGKRVKKHVYSSGVLNEVTVFVYSSGKLIAEYSTAPPPTNPTTKWTVTDLLGSPRILVNSLGEVAARRDFMPFGEEIYPDETHRKTTDKYNFGADGVRQKFTGYERDEETGLDFAEARYYFHTHGRFTAVDPLLASGKSANPQTFNRYVYVVNSPLILVDPDGLQVATATGKVYRKGRNFAIFSGEPMDGYRPVRRTINTTTAINGIEHHATVRPNGWTIGDRVDGAKFDAPAPAATVRPRSDISIVASEVKQGVIDGFTGIAKGIVNAPVYAWNGATGCLLNCGAQGLYFQGSNPFAAPNILAYSNARQESYGSAGSTAALLAPGVVAGAIFGGSAMPSVVPQTAPFRFPPIKSGSAGGPTAGNRYISVDVRRSAAAENPHNICVYCRQQFPNLQNEHAIPISRGGNNTIENIQRACSFCNQSKGARDFPVNPAPGYEGPFPPPWWNQ